jgi:hypothetical protein
VRPRALYHFVVSSLYGLAFPPQALAFVPRSYVWEGEQVEIDIDNDYNDQFIAHEVVAIILTNVHNSHRFPPRPHWTSETLDMYYRFYPWQRAIVPITFPNLGKGDAWVKKAKDYRTFH